MSAPGQPKALDPEKQKTICSLVGEGISLRQVARFVDCDPKTIRREAQRNDDFRQQLDRAKSEANIHPLQTLRQAAKTNWRAALQWMERLDPQRFARHDPKTITQREANQFAVHLTESIEHTVSDASERRNLFELISAVMPAAMRRKWDGKERRRTLAEAINKVNGMKLDERVRCDRRRRDLIKLVQDYLPWHVQQQISQQLNLINLPNEHDTPNDSTAKSQAPDLSELSTPNPNKAEYCPTPEALFHRSRR